MQIIRRDIHPPEAEEGGLRVEGVQALVPVRTVDRRPVRTDDRIWRMRIRQSPWAVRIAEEEGRKSRITG